MIGHRELDLIPSNAVFVNVSRGVVVDSDALIERLKRGDIVAGLDVFDPEPIPPDSESYRAAERLPEPAHRGRDAGQPASILQPDGG